MHVRIDAARMLLALSVLIWTQLLEKLSLMLYVQHHTWTNPTGSSADLDSETAVCMQLFPSANWDFKIHRMDCIS